MIGRVSLESDQNVLFFSFCVCIRAELDWGHNWHSTSCYFETSYNLRRLYKLSICKINMVLYGIKRYPWRSENRFGNWFWNRFCSVKLICFLSLSLTLYHVDISHYLARCYLTRSYLSLLFILPISFYRGKLCSLNLKKNHLIFDQGKNHNASIQNYINIIVSKN